ncbi:MAG TPA: hypothetical protein VM692_13840, partial [Gammaproteobacteria bacterium]|nr:hypothetical protein [Gammaproteobacteria bacterium]
AASRIGATRSIACTSAIQLDLGRVTRRPLDRALMLRKGIDDIRLLRSADPRIAAQMLDLDAYRPVSSQPAIQRDMSIAVATEITPEVLADRVRDVVGARADALESVEVISQTAYSELPSAARDRLGIAAAQKNVLLRLVIRDLTRTLTSEEANAAARRGVRRAAPGLGEDVGPRRLNSLQAQRPAGALTGRRQRALVGQDLHAAIELFL